MDTITRKVIVLGDQGVGKTSTITRYVKKSFPNNTRPTIGGSLFVYKHVDNITIKLEIWDTAGQERYKSVVPKFYRGTNAAIIVFDVTSQQTFESVQEWVAELKTIVESPMVLCVVGNKIDLRENRQVSTDDAYQYARSIGASYYECSAKQDQGVEVIFDDVARALQRLYGNNCTRNEETENLSIRGTAHGSAVNPNFCGFPI
ncbi:hypothetical protein Zmor_020210 [Zophobas morio]|uniref:Uncharacterized protein n=1 Tax=Zophobas morio TaxID=2755281 RepID=A0AA38I3K4_9CUCU|nr:hypothetical protein Zmor_020210 [Zophobas morio]